MIVAAVAGRAVVELAGLGARERHQLGDRGRRRRRRHDQHHRHQPDQADRREVLARVVGDVLEQDGIGGERGGGDQRACGHPPARARGHAEADHAGAAGPVVHHHLLAELLAQPRPEDARGDVGDAARRVGHDQPDRPIRKSLRLSLRCERAQQQTAPSTRCSMRSHGFPPVLMRPAARPRRFLVVLSYRGCLTRQPAAARHPRRSRGSTTRPGVRTPPAGRRGSRASAVASSR